MGLVNYFKDHVDSSYVEYSHRLYELLHKDKDQKRSIQWTDELKEDFERLTELVNNTPKLDYVDDTTECQLCRDASEYGKEVPIQFMSKSSLTLKGDGQFH